MKKKRRKIYPKKTAGIFVAVIVKSNGAGSDRPHGDWASFIGEEETVKNEVVNARAEWEAKGYGPYTILAGWLSQEIQVPVNVRVVPLKKGVFYGTV